MTADRVTIDEGPLRGETERLFHRHRRLRAFPVLAALVSVPLLFVQLWVFKRVMVSLLVLWSPAAVPFGAALLVLQALAVATTVFVGGFALVVAASNAAVVHNVGRVLDDEQPSILAGLAAASRALPQLVVLAVVWAEGGGLLHLSERRTSPGRLGTLVTRLLGVDVAGSMYFAVPAAVLDRAGPIEMFRASYRATEDAFGGPTVVSFGFVKTAVLGYGLPFWLLVGLVVPLSAVVGPGSPQALLERYPLVLMGLPTVLLWLGACTGFAFAAAAKTLLYLDPDGGASVDDLDRSVAELVG